ncbi:hypothetical protein P7K49_007227, partial [Saguinus oedipus]
MPSGSKDEEQRDDCGGRVGNLQGRHMVQRGFSRRCGVQVKKEEQACQKDTEVVNKETSQSGVVRCSQIQSRNSSQSEWSSEVLSNTVLEQQPIRV